MPTFERTVTDTADVAVHGDVAVVTYVPGRPTRTDQACERLVDAAHVPSRRVKDPVAKLMGLPGHQVLTDRGVDELATVPYECTQYGEGWFETDLGSAMPPDLSRVVRCDFATHSFYRFRAERPISRPYRLDGVGLSARRLRLTVAAEILAAHPWVLSVELAAGRPGSYDHVPASVVPIVLLPQDVHDAFHDHLAATRDPGVTAHRLETATTWYVPGPGDPDPDPGGFCAALGFDPFGLAAARVSEDDYDEPSMHDAW